MINQLYQKGVLMFYNLIYGYQFKGIAELLDVGRRIH